MKPQTPEELYADAEDLADEGMLIIGDKARSLCDFSAAPRRVWPKSRQQAFGDPLPSPSSTRRALKTSG